MGHDIASLVRDSAGVAIALLSALGAVATDGPLPRLHFVTPITSWPARSWPLASHPERMGHHAGHDYSRSSACSSSRGPVTAAATGRLMAQADGTVDSEAPE